MTELNNAIIRASAGSGKTYELVRRYLQLLALGEAPEGIAAMTFTRKAAREFFERILQKLAELAGDPEQAKGYVDALANPGEAMALLRKVIRAMDRLRLGTIDGFFASVTRCFPYELGLAGQASIMPENETKQARGEVLNAMLVDITREHDATALSEMLEAWKRATAGKDMNRPTEHLEAWFAELHGLFMECSDEMRWGARATIWPDEKTPAWMAEQDLPKAIERLRDVLDVSLFDNAGQNKWEQFYAEALEKRPGEPFKKSGGIEYMLDEKRGEFHLLREGRAVWMMNKKKPVLDHRTGVALADVLDIIVGRELMCRASRTHGRRDVVARFDAQYERRVRSRGRLAFADLTWLLAGRINALRDEEALFKAHWETLREDWEYRLDGRFQHWLFDEFQDTSRRQWDVVANLVDEAASDPEGRRSFFAVGDLKQSLYLWRQAEPELFLDVESRYANVRMEHRAPLTTSYRSCAEVLAMVNAVFGRSELLKKNYPDAMRWWSFEEHKASVQSAKLNGHAALISVPENDEDDKTKVRDELVATLIGNISPLDRGLTCAVLTRSNDEAKRLSAELRHLLKIEVVCESEVPVALDNPVTLALLSVLQLAAHPGDSYAEEHLRMTPLASWFETHGKNAAALLGAEVRGQISSEGFLATLSIWSERLRGNLGEWDTFSTRRLAQFCDLAAEFDQSGSRDVDAFIEFARDFKVRATEQGRALQVMTIHKAKGLEFDVVIMPHLQSTALDQAVSGGENLLVQRNAIGEIEWLLDKPPTLICNRDERLSNAVRQDKARLSYQGLCRLYVGMTRAKQALYLVLPEKGNARSEVDFLKVALAQEKSVPWKIGETSADCWHETGEREWFVRHVKLADSTTTEIGSKEAAVKLGAMMRKAGAAPQRRAPSGEEVFRIKGGELLSERRDISRRMGTLVHDLFSEVKWLDGLTSKEIETLWQNKKWHLRDGFDEASALVLRALSQKEIRAWFEKSNTGREAWCERRFDMFLKNEWISGIFDRVVLERDGAGEWTSAAILDFKTDAVHDEASMQQRAEGYAPQLKLYAQAVARLTGLTDRKIKMGVIFTQCSQIVWVE